MRTSWSWPATRCAIERHYGRPMDMEWAKDGVDGKLYIVQARPETVASQRSATTLETYVLEGRGEVLAEGRAVGEKIASGAATRDREPRAARGVQARRGAGGRHHHARLGAGDEDRRGDRHQPRRPHLPRRRSSPANSASPPWSAPATRPRRARRRGRDGVLRRGRHRAASTTARWRSTSIAPRSATCRGRATQIMINLGNPDLAFKTSFLPNDGVGLARMEFIISEYIKVHPLALLHPEQVDDPEARRAIERLTRGYPDGERVLRASGSPRASAPSPRPSGRSRSSCACRTSRPTSTPACSAAPASSRPRATRCSASAAPRATRTPPTPRASRWSAARCSGCARRWG